MKSYMRDFGVVFVAALLGAIIEQGVRGKLGTPALDKLNSK